MDDYVSPIHIAGRGGLQTPAPVISVRGDQLGVRIAVNSAVAELDHADAVALIRALQAAHSRAAP
jgi:hypothetical protein